MGSQLGQPAAGAASACTQARAPWGMALLRASQDGETALVWEGSAEDRGGEKSNLWASSLEMPVAYAGVAEMEMYGGSWWNWTCCPSFLPGLGSFCGELMPWGVRKSL